MKRLFPLAGIACGILLFASNAPAQCYQCYEYDCANMEYPDDDCDEMGSSIKPSRGQKTRDVTDLQTFGAAPVAFTRVYNSRTTDFTSQYVDFGVRQTWQHNWNYEVRDLQTTTNGHKHVKVRYPNGNEFNFVAADTNGIIRVPPAFHGDRLYKWTGTNVGHTLVTPGGWEYDFERTTSPKYRLAEVRNGQGLSWTLGYDATNGKVDRIENNFGRWIEVDRGVSNGVECITGVRSSDGREVTYDYGLWQYSIISTTFVPVVTCVTNESSGEGGTEITIVCTTNLVPDITTNDVTNTLLTGVNYPDGSEAAYTYVGGWGLTNGRPLVATASDPMHPGAGARVKFVYNYDFIFDFGNGP
jgi:hypothetical protein